MTLLLLLARVVECGADDREVSMALDMLFTTVNASEETKRDFLSSEGIGLLSRILEDDSCSLGFHSVTTILNHSCTTPILVSDGGETNQGRDRELLTFNAGADAIVHSPFIFSLLVNCWKSLNRPVTRDEAAIVDCSTLRELVLESFCLLLRSGNHEFAKINTETFRHLGLARAIVYKLLEEKSFEEEGGGENAVKVESPSKGDFCRVAEKVVTIFGLLAGSPPNLKMLSDIMVSILLMVDSGDTFVAHSKREGFFFNINAAPVLKNWRSGGAAPAAGRLQQMLSSHSANRGSGRVGADGAAAKSFHGLSSTSSLGEEHLIGTVLGRGRGESPLNAASQEEFLGREDLQKTLKQIRDRRHSDGKSAGATAAAAKKDEEGAAAASSLHYGQISKSAKPLVQQETDEGSKNIRVVITKEESIEEVGDLVIESSQAEEQGREEEEPEQAEEALKSEGNEVRANSEDHDADDEVVDGEKTFEVVAAPEQSNVLEHPGKWGKEETIVKDEVASPSMDMSEKIICGLLDIMSGLLQNLPDAAVPHVTGEVVLPEHLLVLCNHPSDAVRERAAWLLWRHVSRSSSTTSNGGRLARIGGYRLLSEQLYRRPVTETLVNACLSMVHDRDFVLVESPEIPAHAQVNIKVIFLKTSYLGPLCWSCKLSSS